MGVGNETGNGELDHGVSGLLGNFGKYDFEFGTLGKV